MFPMFVQSHDKRILLRKKNCCVEVDLKYTFNKALNNSF